MPAIWTGAECIQRFATLDPLWAHSPEIDRFCSSSYWALSAHEAIMPPGRIPALLVDAPQAPNAAVAFCYSRQARGWGYFEPYELAWGLASPLAGDPAVAAQLAVAWLAKQPNWGVAVIAGIVADGVHARAVRKVAPRGWQLVVSEAAIRHVASLDGGLDGYWQRRSRQFRKNQRKAEQRATAAGITFERVAVAEAAAPSVYARLLAIESRSWKSAEGVGLAVPQMQAFYAAMLPRLAARSAARVIIARHEDKDVGYVFGGVLGDTYRGLQFSYDHRYRAYGIGALLQVAQLRDLTAEAHIRFYDLGSDMAYKRDWAEHPFTTHAHLLQRA